jgi:hypothetical protein
VVDALFYNFAPGEVTRHVPKNPRRPGQRSCIRAHRRAADQGGDQRPGGGPADVRRVARDPDPEDKVARLFHAAALLREHRGDGVIAALMSERIGGLEAHVLLALDMDLPAERFGRIHRSRDCIVRIRLGTSQRTPGAATCGDLRYLGTP